MGGISANVGIFSGIDTASLIEQLLAIEARPKFLAQTRVVGLQAQQAALLDVNASLLALKTASGTFRTSSTFRSARATSSNPSVLTAIASTGAATGTYNFTVSRLVSTDQQISRGFADRDVSGVGLEDLTFELGGGRLDSETTLAALRGGEGVSRGKVRITDGSGGTTVVDLSTAVTINDVLEAINTASGVEVSAAVDTTNGDRLKITDNSGGAGNLVIENVFGSDTATDLGIATAGVAGSLTGSVINHLGESFALSALNDGAGVAIRSSASSDLKITTRDDVVYNVRLGEILDLDGEVTDTAVATIGDLIERIESQTAGKVQVELRADGQGLKLIDTTNATDSDLIVEEVSADRSTARDLGILGSSATAELEGRRLISTINSRLSSSLNGGSGVSAGTIVIQRTNLTNFSVAIDADDSINDIIQAINSAGAGTVTASLNDAGNGLNVVDSAGGAGPLVISSLVGNAAEDLGIEGSFADGESRSGNLQSRYISGATRLSDLRAKSGVGTGTFRIYDSTGVSSSVVVDSTIKTLDDLIALINSRPTDIVARINDTGDGLLFEDTTNGGQAIRVEDVTGAVAKNLGVLGTSEGSGAADNLLDGSYEETIDLDDTDTLDEVVSKVNAAGIFVTASVINDGSGSTPFRLSFTSKHSGAVGRLTIDSDDVDLNLSALTQGRDAVAFFGAADPAQAVLLTSSTNTLDNVLTGVSIDLNATSDEPVELVVSRDNAAIEAQVKLFVDAFNEVFKRIGKYDTYNQETNQRGALFGDSTVDNVRQNLLRVVQGEPLGVSGQFSRLFQVGVKVGDGALLEFDVDKFRAALEQDPAGVEELFAAFEQDPIEDEVLFEDEDGNPLVTTPSTTTTYSVLGVAELIKQLADSMTDATDGVLTRRKNTLDSQIDQQSDRIDAFNLALDRKRSRLEAQFLAMERAIASLQGQQAALGSLFAN